MSRANIFDGESLLAMFARIVYRQFVTRQWVTYADVLAEYDPKGFAKGDKLSVYDGYGELKKAFSGVRRLINEKAAAECFETSGNNRDKRFRYTGIDDDPLHDLFVAKVISDLRDYWQFCQDSAGFFPDSWLEYFFDGCKDLLDIKRTRRRGKRILSTDDRIPRGIEYLPVLYDAIKGQKVLTIDYQPYGEPTTTYIVHPHYLREYNGRWFLFGYFEPVSRVAAPAYTAQNFPLDRIAAKPRIAADIVYRRRDDGYYDRYFEDIVGVTHIAGNTAQDIRVRAHTMYMFKLTDTKKIHSSQRIVTDFGEHKDGTYGEFALHVEVNNELVGRILQMGADLEIMAPESIRKIFKERIEATANRYK